MLRVVALTLLACFAGCTNQRKPSPEFRQAAESVIDADTLMEIQSAIPFAKRAVKTQEDAEIFDDLFDYYGWMRRYSDESAKLDSEMDLIKAEGRPANSSQKKLLDSRMALIDLEVKAASECREVVLRRLPYIPHSLRRFFDPKLKAGEEPTCLSAH